MLPLLPPLLLAALLLLAMLLLFCCLAHSLPIWPDEYEMDKRLLVSAVSGHDSGSHGQLPVLLLLLTLSHYFGATFIDNLGTVRSRVWVWVWV